MGFIIRSVFWLSLVLLLIPIGGPEADSAGESVSPLQAFFAVREAVGDITGMCGRKPEVCEIGRSAAATIGMRAREGARMAIAMIEEEAEPDSGEQEIVVTGSIPEGR